MNEAAVAAGEAYAREPRKLPVIVQFLEAVSSLKCRAAFTCCYAAGLRASEAGGLMVAGIESAGRHPGPARQGGERPHVMLPPPLLGIRPA
ncbi:MAG: hypothetical protein ACT4O2_07770 [Beijerinckiaceae bacterium]